MGHFPNPYTPCGVPLQAGLLLIRQQQRVMAAHAHGVRWSRYTVLLRWQRAAPATNQELSAFCSHYGPVVSAVNIVSAGPALRAGQKLDNSRCALAPAPLLSLHPCKTSLHRVARSGDLSEPAAPRVRHAQHGISLIVVQSLVPAAQDWVYEHVSAGLYLII